MGMNGAEIEPTVPEPTTEETSGETVEEIEDRLIAALDRAEQLESRLAECERRLGEFEASRAVLQPGNSEHPEGTLDTTPADRKPDTPPRAHTPLADWYFRRVGE